MLTGRRFALGLVLHDHFQQPGAQLLLLLFLAPRRRLDVGLSRTLHRNPSCGAPDAKSGAFP
jgi:hypothetical protein